MKTHVKAILTVVPVTILSLLLSPHAPLGQALWPEPAHDNHAEGAQRLGFMAVGLLEGVATGAGLAYLLHGLPVSRRHAGARAVPFHIALSWLLMNWWLHDSLHFVNGLDLTGLLIIDVAFHGTMIASAALVVWTLATGRAGPDGTRAPAALGRHA